MKKYNINIAGCDDDTDVQMMLSDAQVKLLIGLATLVNNAKDDNRCKPSMEVTLTTN